VIAWKAGRESARAAFDALPFLLQAKTVQILEVKEGRGRDDAEALAPDTSIAAALARHGIKPTVRPRLRPTSVSATRCFRASPTPARICW
jgi:hypothetical protein